MSFSQIDHFNWKLLFTSVHVPDVKNFSVPSNVNSKNRQIWFENCLLNIVIYKDAFDDMLLMTVVVGIIF